MGNYFSITSAALLFLLVSCLQADKLEIQPGVADVATWRSTLYPVEWQPGDSDESGRFLHDFSYAGYHYGASLPESVPGPVVHVTDAPYSADSTGMADATDAIQRALDAVGQAGGGVVYLPEGTYRVSPSPAVSDAVLKIRYDGVVLRGAGAGKTYLLNHSYKMREIAVIDVRPGKITSWNADGKDAAGIALKQDLPLPAIEIPLDDVSGLKVGDAIVIRNDLTQHYIDLIGMHGKWTPAQSRNRTLTYYRRIVSIDGDAGLIRIDIPTRGYLYRADHARVVPVQGEMLTDVGVESLSIGMKAHPGEGLEMRDFKKPGTIAYDVHQSAAIQFTHVENGWIRSVSSFAPEGNPEQVHLLSHGVKLIRSRGITVRDCDLRYPQYLGEGGNGYLYIMQGQDNLVEKCSATGGRHNYSFGTMSSSGNVLVDCLSRDSWLPSDFHMFLSLANLLDNMTCDGDYLEARAIRPWGGKVMHGVTTTESVFWNTNGLRYAPDRDWVIFSHQQGEGYVIGTRGPANQVNSSDFIEGVGRGDGLEPRSLYYDQLKRRKGAQ